MSSEYNHPAPGLKRPSSKLSAVGTPPDFAAQKQASEAELAMLGLLALMAGQQQAAPPQAPQMPPAAPVQSEEQAMLAALMAGG